MHLGIFVFKLFSLKVFLEESIVKCCSKKTINDLPTLLIIFQIFESVSLILLNTNVFS